MFTMLVSIFVRIIFVIVWILIESVICLYIFRNSRRYGMNTFLWVLAGLVLNLPGLCIFLYARKKALLHKCPECLSLTDENSEKCSVCGVFLESVRPTVGRFSKILLGICCGLMLFGAVELLFTYLYSR